MNQTLKALTVPTLLLLATVLLMVIAAGCGVEIKLGDEPATCPDGRCPYQSQPVHDDPCPVRATGWSEVPQGIRDANYAGGSCLYASLCTALRWVGLHQAADRIRSTYSGGQSVDGLTEICDQMGLRFAATVEGEAELLEWASRTRRAAAIHYFPVHAVTFTGYRQGSDGQFYAILIDNNRTGEDITIPKERFVREWRAYGGRALVPVYSPPPPRPWR